MRNLILKKNHTQYFLTHESKKADTAVCLCIAIYSCRQYKAVQQQSEVTIIQIQISYYLLFVLLIFAVFKFKRLRLQDLIRKQKTPQNY